MRVFYNYHPQLLDSVSAKGYAARRFVNVGPNLCLKPLTIGIDQADKSGWRVAHMSRERSNVVVGRLCRRI